jgi:predicted phosphate transport protein (TIGR00153 family)
MRKREDFKIMLSRFMPREDKFFTLFQKSSELMVEGANELHNLFKDIAHVEKYSRRIKEIEHQADEVTHHTIELLHSTFITPLDREDIHQLISKMDDILDFMEAAAQRIHLYDITTAPPYAAELAEICVKSAETIKAGVAMLEDMKNRKELLKICIEIHRLENEADVLFRSATAKLFREEPDTRQLIKHKEIYEILETTTDRCEDVANIIEGIVLEYA